MTSHDERREVRGLDLTNKTLGTEKTYKAAKGRSEQTWKERKTVTIDRISGGGNPIAEAKHRGKHIHVPDARPGDSVEIVIKEDHGNFYKGFMIGPDGMTEKERKREKKKEKRKEELREREKRKEKKEQKRETESRESMRVIAERVGQCLSPQDSDANEGRYTEGPGKSDRKQEIREEVGSKYD